MRNSSEGIHFSHNHFSKLYWVIGIVGIIVGMIQAKGSNMMWILPLALIYGFFAVKAMIHQVMVKNSRIISKDLMAKKSILINQNSKIYILKSLESINFIIRRYNYWIEVVNPNDRLKFNANVNDADELYHLVDQLEQQIIAPHAFESFQRNRQIRFDDDWQLTEDAIIFKGKTYSFFDLSGVRLNNGQFSLMKAGKLWNTAVLTQPVAKIPNFNIFYALLRSVSGFS